MGIRSGSLVAFEFSTDPVRALRVSEHPLSLDPCLVGSPHSTTDRSTERGSAMIIRGKAKGSGHDR
jgi:hypothetical protein